MSASPILGRLADLADGAATPASRQGVLRRWTEFGIIDIAGPCV